MHQNAPYLETLVDKYYISLLSRVTSKFKNPLSALHKGGKSANLNIQMTSDAHMVTLVTSDLNV